MHCNAGTGWTSVDELQEKIHRPASSLPASTRKCPGLNSLAREPKWQQSFLMTNLAPNSRPEVSQGMRTKSNEINRAELAKKSSSLLDVAAMISRWNDRLARF